MSNKATHPHVPHLPPRSPSWNILHGISRCSYETDVNGLIGYAVGRDLEKHLGCIFMETSTKQPFSVDKAFYSAVREIRKYNKVCLVCILRESEI